MAFKGGTSLSKIYNIIDRFSEDVDITLDYRHFDEQFNPFKTGVSNNQIKKFSERLKGYVKEYANDRVIPFINSELKKLPFGSEQTISIDDSGEKIWVSYPSVIESTDEYMKSEILIELGGRNVIDPNERHIITPYIAEMTKGLNYPEGEVTVLSPARTFWEKATLIHVECNREQFKINAERLSRHWYDLVKISQHSSGKSAINDRYLFEDVIKHKKIFFNASYAKYDACLDNQLKLLPNTDSIKKLKSDYEEMIKAGMMYQTPPDFTEIMDILRQIEIDINCW